MPGLASDGSEAVSSFVKKLLSPPPEGVMGALPHRYPFLLLDFVREISVPESLVAIKNVTFNEPFFQGHFPENPVMPGVLMLEAMAQASGLLHFSEIIALGISEGTSFGNILFFGADKVRFRGVVRPGDVLRICVDKTASNLRSLVFTSKVGVFSDKDGKRIAEAEVKTTRSK